MSITTRLQMMAIDLVCMAFVTWGLGIPWSGLVLYVAVKGWTISDRILWENIK